MKSDEKFFDEKQVQKCQESKYQESSILYSELASLTRDVTCSRCGDTEIQRKNIRDKKLSVEHTLSKKAVIET